MIVVFGSLVLLADQLRRLISHFVVNRTIGKALDKAPETVPLLVAKIEDYKPWPISPFGWAALIFGLIFTGMLFLSPEAPSAQDIGIPVGTLLLGVILLLAHRKNVARTKGESTEESELKG
jgi:hypothetical protein